MRPGTPHRTGSGARAAALVICTVLPVALYAASQDSLQTTTIRITSEPDSALVFVDGARRGSTPLELSGVLPGVHTLRLVVQDPASWFSDVTRDTVLVESGADRALHYRIDHRCAVMTVPSGADLFIGDSLAGTTPAVVPFDVIRSGIVRVRKAGYAEVQVAPPPGSGSSVVLSLDPAGTPVPEPAVVVGNGMSRNQTTIWIAATSVILSGAVAAYFKVTADEKNAGYLDSGNPVLRTQRDQRDRDAAVALVTTQVSLALLIGLLLAE